MEIFIYLLSHVMHVVKISAHLRGGMMSFPESWILFIITQKKLIWLCYTTFSIMTKNSAGVDGERLQTKFVLLYRNMWYECMRGYIRWANTIHTYLVIFCFVPGNVILHRITITYPNEFLVVKTFLDGLARRFEFYFRSCSLYLWFRHWHRFFFACMTIAYRGPHATGLE